MATRAGVLCALALLLATPASARAERSDCFPRGTVTVAHSDSGRVYTYGPETGDTAVACLYRSGIKRELTEDEFTRQSFGPWAIAGRYVAYHGQACTEIGGCYHNVYVLDLKTDEVLRQASNTGDTCEYSAVSAGANCGTRDVRGIVVKRNGTAAWLTAHSPRAVWRLDAGGLTQLDRSVGIDVRSLRMHEARTRVTWVNGGERRSAALR